MKNFLLQAFALKNLHRAGWVRAGLEEPESVADHSWGVALLAVCLCPPHLNREKLLAMALIHDLPEVKVGDITPHDGITKQQKHTMEENAAKDLFSPSLYALWREAVEKKSPESKFLNQLDKLEMGLQAQIYKDKIDVHEFIQSAQKSLTEPGLIKLLLSEE